MHQSFQNTLDVMKNLEWTSMFWVKYLFKNLPRVIVVAVFGYLTAKTSSNLFLEFANGKTAASVTAVFAKNISLPSTTLYLPILWAELYYSQLTSNLSESHYSDYLSNGIQSGVFLKANLLHNNWTNTLLYIANDYLACMTTFEFLLNDPTPCYENLSILTTDEFEAWNAFAEQLQINNVSTDELRQKYGREIAAAFSLRVTQQSILGTRAIDFDSIKTTFVDNHGIFICYRLPLNLHPLQRGIRDAFVIESTPPLTNFSSDYVGLDIVSHVLIDFSGRTFTTMADTKQSNLVTYSTFLQPHTFVPISMDNTFQASPEVNRSVRCSLNQSVDACMAECKANYIRRECNCTTTNKNYLSTTISSVVLS
jgi:hypothetical protein